MDYIGKVFKDKRRYFGWKKPLTAYQKKKETIIKDFLFFLKKVKKIKKIEEVNNWEDLINEYINLKRYKEGSKKERVSMINSFLKRNYLWR